MKKRILKTKWENIFLPLMIWLSISSMLAHNQTELITIIEELALYTMFIVGIYYGTREIRKDMLYERWNDEEYN